MFDRSVRMQGRENISGCCFLFADNSLFITNQKIYTFKFKNVQASNLFKQSALISGCHYGDIPSQVFQEGLNTESAEPIK